MRERAESGERRAESGERREKTVTAKARDQTALTASSDASSPMAAMLASLLRNASPCKPQRTHVLKKASVRTGRGVNIFSADVRQGLRWSENGSDTAWSFTTRSQTRRKAVLGESRGVQPLSSQHGPRVGRSFAHNRISPAHGINNEQPIHRVTTTTNLDCTFVL